MARNTRPPRHDYIISERALRTLFILGAAAGGLLIVGLLLAMSARPQGRYVTPDRSQYNATLERATQALGGYHQDAESGRVAIPIERAIELVAERGVTGIQFGAASSQQQTAPADVTDDGTATEGTTEGAEDTGAATAALPDGRQVFTSCAGCHGPAGEGVANVAPPLAGHAAELYAAEGGREYLVHVLLYGLQGPIEVEGNAYNGVMPAWAYLGDAEIASVLNYIVAGLDDAAAPEDFAPYGPDDIAAERDLNLTAGQVHDEREALDLNE